MDCCRLGRWRGASVSARGHGGGRPAAAPSSFTSYLNQSSTPHCQHEHYDHRFSSSSVEQDYLIPKQQHHHRRRSRWSSNMPGPGSTYQESVFGGGDHDRTKSGQSYRITISNRELKWEYLQEYLGLEFEGLKVPKEQTKTLNEKYVLTLPVKLSAKQLQDIDLLRGDDDDARMFLEDLKIEKEKERLATVQE